MDNFFNKKSNQILGSLVLLMVIIALGAYAYLTLEQTKYDIGGPTIITVSGEGEVLAFPDIGQFSFGVEAEGEDAATAQTESATKINDILTYLKESGVKEADIVTQSYNLQPRYRYEQRTCVMGSYCPPGEQVMDGFVVSQMVTVKVRTLETAGTLIAGVGERGATNLSGLSFTIDDTDVLEANARALAIADAQTKAIELARTLGVRLDRITGYYEEETGGIPFYGKGDAMMMESRSFNTVAPELPTGEQKTVKRVSITYQVR